jgi:cold shock CspA family protein
METTLATGFIKWIKFEKGWGCIESDEVPGDVWFHFGDLNFPLEDLKQGQRVRFVSLSAEQDSWKFRAEKISRAE